VHVGQDDLPPAAARHLLGAAAIVGYSTHTPGQIEAGRARTDYLRGNRTRVRHPDQGDGLRRGGAGNGHARGAGVWRAPGCGDWRHHARRSPSGRRGRRRRRGGDQRFCLAGNPRVRVAAYCKSLGL
jgi:hypothetical protein